MNNEYKRTGTNIAKTVTALLDSKAVAQFSEGVVGISEEDARRYFEYADVVTACASKWVREVAKERATIQAGKKVPVYGASEFGEAIIRLKLEELGKEPDTILDEDPEPLV